MCRSDTRENDGVLLEILKAVGLDYLDLDELVGDIGRPLSGGELMRLNILRCYMSGSNVIILDETLSSLPEDQRVIVGF